MFNAPGPYQQPQPQENMFRTMARRALPAPGVRKPALSQAPAAPRQPPVQYPAPSGSMAQPPAPAVQPPPVAPGPPQPQAPPPPMPGLPPTSASMPGTGGGFMAQPPAPPAGPMGGAPATASSDDVNLLPTFQAERAKRLMMAQRMASGPGNFAY